VPGTKLCGSHSRSAALLKGLAHGLVDGPIPSEKLLDFQKFAVLNSARVFAEFDTAILPEPKPNLDLEAVIAGSRSCDSIPLPHVRPQRSLTRKRKRKTSRDHVQPGEGDPLRRNQSLRQSLRSLRNVQPDDCDLLRRSTRLRKLEPSHRGAGLPDDVRRLPEATKRKPLGKKKSEIGARFLSKHRVAALSAAVDKAVLDKDTEASMGPEVLRCLLAKSGGVERDCMSRLTTLMASIGENEVDARFAVFRSLCKTTDVESLVAFVDAGGLSALRPFLEAAIPSNGSSTPGTYDELMPEVFVWLRTLPINYDQLSQSGIGRVIRALQLQSASTKDVAGELIAFWKYRFHKEVFQRQLQRQKADVTPMPSASVDSAGAAVPPVDDVSALVMSCPAAAPRPFTSVIGGSPRQWPPRHHWSLPQPVAGLPVYAPTSDAPTGLSRLFDLEGPSSKVGTSEDGVAACVDLTAVVPDPLPRHAPRPAARRAQEAARKEQREHDNHVEATLQQLLLLNESLERKSAMPLQVNEAPDRRSDEPPTTRKPALVETPEKTVSPEDLRDPEDGSSSSFSFSPSPINPPSPSGSSSSDSIPPSHTLTMPSSSIDRPSQGKPKVAVPGAEDSGVSDEVLDVTVSSDDKEDFRVRFFCSTPLGELMDAWCQQHDCNRASVQFLVLGGRVLCPEDTPTDIGVSVAQGVLDIFALMTESVQQESSPRVAKEQLAKHSVKQTASPATAKKQLTKPGSLQLPASASPPSVPQPHTEAASGCSTEHSSSAAAIAVQRRKELQNDKSAMVQTGKAVQEGKINVVVLARGSKGDQKLSFSMCPDSPFEKVMSYWSRLHHVTLKSAVFLHGGVELSPEETPRGRGWKPAPWSDVAPCAFVIRAAPRAALEAALKDSPG